MAHPFKNYGTSNRQGPMDLARAREIATDAFLFLISEPAQLVRFLDTSGIDPTTLSARATDPELLAFVLDHVLQDESLLLTFAANAQVTPERIAAAAHVLSGAPPQTSL